MGYFNDAKIISSIHQKVDFSLLHERCNIAHKEFDSILKGYKTYIDDLLCDHNELETIELIQERVDDDYTSVYGDYRVEVVTNDRKEVLELRTDDIIPMIAQDIDLSRELNESILKDTLKEHGYIVNKITAY